MKNLISLNRSGMSPEVTSSEVSQKRGTLHRKGRHAIGSILSRFSLASLICLCMLTVGVGNAWGTPTVLFHETFGNKTDKGNRAWSDTYSVKSGVSAVYTDVEYTVSANQYRNTVGYGTGSSPLGQTANNTEASFIFGPLHVSSYESLQLTYYWNAGSVGGTYSSTLSYKTSSGGSWTSVARTSGSGATSYQQMVYDLPTTAQVNTLYLKITWCTSNTIGYMDEVELTGTAGSSCTSTKLGTPVVTATTSNTQVVLSWGAVSNASGYKYKWNGGSWTETASTSVTKTGLTNGTEYTYQVQAIGDGDDYCDGDASAEASITAGPCYTVSFSTGTGNPTVTSISEVENEGCIELPDGPTPACSSDGWEFAGWSATEYNIDNTTNVGRLYAPGDYYCPEGSNRILYAVYRKLTSGTSSAIYTGNSRTNLTLIASSESVDYWWYHTATGVEFYINNYGIYDDEFDIYNSKGSDNNGWAVIDAHRPITSISFTKTSSDDLYASLSSTEPGAGTVTLDGSTITCTGSVTKVVLETSTDQYSDVMLSTFTVTYKNCKFLSNPSCCDKAITVSSPTITGEGTIEFTPSTSPIATCDDDVEIVATVTPAAGYECTALSFTGGSVSVSPSIASNKPAYPSSQDFTLSFAQNTNATLTTSATFTAKALTGWTWGYRKDADAKNNTGDILAIPDIIEAYIGQYVRFDITGYTPNDVLAAKKGYTYTAGGVAPEYDNTKLSYVGADGSHLTYYTTKGLKAGDATLTFTSVGNGELTKTVTIRVKAMPVVKFKDLVHGESFDDVAGTVGTGGNAGIVTITKATPTHSDLDKPGSGNSCEKQHLHLVGWIRSDWPALVAYLNGTGSAPTTSAITTAGVDGDSKNYYLAAGTSLNTETYNGFTFYAVWAKVE